MTSSQTAMPLVGGILSIVAGVISLFGVMGLLIGVAFISSGAVRNGFFYRVDIGVAVVAFLCTLFLVAGVLAVLGGVFALQRKHWGLGLAGSIAAIFPSVPLGVVAIVLMTISREEFST